MSTDVSSISNTSFSLFSIRNNFLSYFLFCFVSSVLFLCRFISLHFVSIFLVVVNFVWLIRCRRIALRVAFIVNTNANRLFHDGYITRRWTFKWHNHPYWSWPPILRYVWASHGTHISYRIWIYNIQSACEFVMYVHCALCIFNRYDSRKQKAAAAT